MMHLDRHALDLSMQLLELAESLVSPLLRQSRYDTASVPHSGLSERL
jgi:hypothetical protein